MRILDTSASDIRQCNRLTIDKVAALLVGRGHNEGSHRDIVLFTFGGQLERISATHPNYMALQYLLLFPYGENGWRLNIPRNIEETSSHRKKGCVSIREYYCFRLQYRNSEGKTLLLGGVYFINFSGSVCLH